MVILIDLQVSIQVKIMTGKIFLSQVIVTASRFPLWLGVSEQKSPLYIVCVASPHLSSYIGHDVLIGNDNGRYIGPEDRDSFIETKFDDREANRKKLLIFNKSFLE